MADLVLGNALEVLIDHRGKTPRKLDSDFVDFGIPVASAILVSDGRLALDEARHVDEDTYQRWMPVATQRGDVVLTSEAPLGRVARVSSDGPLALGQRLYGLRGAPGILDSGYLYYALQTERVQADLLGRATGTTVVGIRQSALRNVVVPAPPYPEQQAIAEVLGALDDKIAANERVAQAATALADAVFSRLVRGVPFSELTFADVADVRGGGTPKTKVDEYWDGEISWATPTDVTSLSGPYLARTARTISDEGLSNCASSLYPSGSILMTSRATIGAFAVAQQPTAVNQGFIVVNAHSDEHQWWLFHEMRQRVPEFMSYANGATFQELSRRRFKSLSVRVPDSAAASAFHQEVDALHAAAANAMAEIAALAATRDELLPLLMSGRLRVADAEQVVSDAT